jgi:hypothetical protein
MILHKDDVEAIERIIARVREPKKTAHEIAKWFACRFADSKDGSPFQKPDCEHRYVRPTFRKLPSGREIVSDVKCVDCNKAMHPAELGFTPEDSTHQ